MSKSTSEGPSCLTCLYYSRCTVAPSGLHSRLPVATTVVDRLSHHPRHFDLLQLLRSSNSSSNKVATVAVGELAQAQPAELVSTATSADGAGHVVAALVLRDGNRTVRAPLRVLGILPQPLLHVLRGWAWALSVLRIAAASAVRTLAERALDGAFFHILWSDHTDNDMASDTPHLPPGEGNPARSFAVPLESVHEIQGAETDVHVGCGKKRSALWDATGHTGDRRGQSSVCLGEVLPEAGPAPEMRLVVALTEHTVSERVTTNAALEHPFFTRGGPSRARAWRLFSLLHRRLETQLVGHGSQPSGAVPQGRGTFHGVPVGDTCF
mmetsp:Transcript_17440/g.50946  ORF Transcript_17440/g.50946 Transcript_17440/m.50946 type:complete len:324 (-) Transcript_17440:508-1479(-)